MVNARTFRLWQHLAVSDDLPDQALPTVIEALCSPIQSLYGGNDHRENWRQSALKEALPVLLRRATEPSPRQRLLEQIDSHELADCAEKALVTAADIPLILRTHKVTPDLVIGLARHPGQVNAAISLLPHVAEHELEYVVTHWNLRIHSSREPVPPIPTDLFDAVLERSLTPLAGALLSPERHEDWNRSLDFDLGYSLQLGDGPQWRILSTCPERWRELINHPTVGAVVQHLLLDQAEVEVQRHLLTSTSAYPTNETNKRRAPTRTGTALDEDLLRACLPALCLQELAGLPKPSVSARHRLHHIAQRVRHNPRLIDLAAQELHDVSNFCVRRGRLLSAPRKKQDARHVVRLAEDLALLSSNPEHLAKACNLLGRMEQPKVVSHPPSKRWSRPIVDLVRDIETPIRLLERDWQHRRVEALTALANNAHTPRAAATEVMSVLHPLELTWLAHRDGAPDWLRTAAIALAPANEEEGVLRLLTDDELERHPAPAAVLQSWLDAPEKDGVWSGDSVYHAILRSRHHTLEHLRQMPMDEVVTWDSPCVALPALLEHCGADPERWQTLLSALDFDNPKTTFGELLDTLAAGQQEPTAPV